MTEGTEDQPILTDVQRRREYAVRAARAVLGKTGFASSELAAHVAEVVDLAEYILAGTHPFDRHIDDAAEEPDS